jgi:hypothetical protein
MQRTEAGDLPQSEHSLPNSRSSATSACQKKNSRAVVLCLAPTSESFLISFSPPTESELWTPLKINHPEARLYSGSTVLPVIVS